MIGIAKTRFLVLGSERIHARTIASILPGTPVLSITQRAKFPRYLTLRDISVDDTRGTTIVNVVHPRTHPYDGVSEDTANLLHHITHAGIQLKLA